MAIKLIARVIGSAIGWSIGKVIIEGKIARSDLWDIVKTGSFIGVVTTIILEIIGG